MQLRRRGDVHAREHGAAAVEFALLVPIFALLTVGMLSGGVMLWHTIATTQASRDAARLASTNPIASVPTPAPDGSQGYTIEDWLRRAMYVAEQGAGWQPASEATVLVADLNPTGEAGYVCVSYVKGSGGTLTSKRMVAGTPASGEPAVTTPATPVVDGSCYTDSATLTSPRVQVVVHRRENFNLLVLSRNFDVYGRANMPYEREVP